MMSDDREENEKIACEVIRVTDDPRFLEDKIVEVLDAKDAIIKARDEEIENLKSELEAEKKRREEAEFVKKELSLKCYSCGEPIKYDKERPECYCNDCENMETVGKLTQAQERIKSLEAGGVKFGCWLCPNCGKAAPSGQKCYPCLLAENAVLVGALKKISDQFVIEVTSKNDFYYPKPICKNPPVIPASGVNGCLSCQVSATCLLVNKSNEHISNSPNSKAYAEAVWNLEVVLNQLIDCGHELADEVQCSKDSKTVLDWLGIEDLAKKSLAQLNKARGI